MERLLVLCVDLTVTLGSTFFFNPCITVYRLPFLADNSKYVAALLFIFFKACTKGQLMSDTSLKH